MRSNTRRLFFALWPSDEVRDAVVETSLPVCKKSGGRNITPQNLHITLHFIGQVSEELKQCMHDAAKTVTGTPFQVNLDNYGHFSRARIFWMGMKETPAEFGLLHEELGEALSRCGYQCDKRPFRPHMSLIRKCTSPEPDQQKFSIPWMVKDFVLVESLQDITGVKYRVIEKYPLS